VTVRLDNDFIQHLTYIIPQFDISVLQKILGIIITSSISVTSVIFSITVLTLSMASNQLGPRLLPNFIRQGKTQFVIAIFISIYVYCLLLLMISSIENQNQYILSFLVGIALGIFSFLVLIYFIHFVCNIIQIENFLDYLSFKIKQGLQRNFTDEKIKDELATQKTTSSLTRARDIFSKQEGYIQVIQYDRLLTVTNKHQCIIQVIKRPGHYLTKGVEIAKISNRHADIDALQSDINQCFIVGKQRTDIQDVEYGFEQIVEIAIRALSPGINNAYTAICCISHLASLLTMLSHKNIPPGYIKGEGDAIVYFEQFSYEGIINTALDQLRQSAAPHCDVTIALLKMLKQVRSTNQRLEVELTLKQQAEIIFETAKKQSFHEADLKKIALVYWN